MHPTGLAVAWLGLAWLCGGGGCFSGVQCFQCKKFLNRGTPLAVDDNRVNSPPGPLAGDVKELPWCLIMFVLEVAMVRDDVCIGCHFRKRVLTEQLAITSCRFSNFSRFL